MSEQIDVNMWRVTANGDVETTGWPYRPGETVFELMSKTASWHDWRNYRLAYGAQGGQLFSPPRQVQWASISIEDNPTTTMQALFSGVQLDVGESYFLMISRLVDGGTSRQNERKRDLSALYPLETHNAWTIGTLEGGQRQLQILLCNLKRTV
jgi:hypothetical protein